MISFQSIAKRCGAIVLLGMIAYGCAPISTGQYEQVSETDGPAIFVFDYTHKLKKERYKNIVVTETLVSESTDLDLLAVRPYLAVVHPKIASRTRYRYFEPGREGGYQGPNGRIFDFFQREPFLEFSFGPNQSSSDMLFGDVAEARRKLREVVQGYPGPLKIFYCSNSDFDSSCDLIFE